MANLNSAGAQRSLVDLSARTVLPIETRRAAALAFGRSVRRHGLLLTNEEIRHLYDRYNASGDQPPESVQLLHIAAGHDRRQDQARAGGQCPGGREALTTLTARLRLSMSNFLRSSDDASPPIPGLIGSGPAMQNVYRLTRQVARSHASVLLLGETGTGKELIAKAVHQLSPRGSGPFVRVNCGALSESLLESELFGHVPRLVHRSNRQPHRPIRGRPHRHDLSR